MFTDSRFVVGMDLGSHGEKMSVMTIDSTEKTKLKIRF